MRRSAAGAMAGAAIALLASCAVEAPPPGGEPDRELPRLSTTSPADTATAVPRGNPIVIDWTEPMDRRTAERALIVAPPVRWARVSWDRSRLTLVPADSLEPGRTYVVVAGRSAKDRHGNAAGKAHTFAFTTGDSLPRGSVSGRVAPLAANENARVFALAASGDDTAIPSLRDGDFRSAAETDSGGVFTLGHLDAAANYRVAAYVDRDASGSFTPDAGDPWGYAARPASPAAPAGELAVVLMDPDREGLLRGVLIGDTGGEGHVLVIAQPEAESLKTVVGTPDSVGGRFLMAARAGRYRVGAFRDFDGNGKYDSVRVAPAPERPDTSAAHPDTGAVSPPDTSGAPHLEAPRTMGMGDTMTTRAEESTARDTTAARRDTTVAAPGDSTRGVTPAAAPGDTTAAGVPPAPPSPPPPPDVVEWRPDPVEVVAGAVSPYVTVSAPPVAVKPDSTGGSR